MAHRHSLESGSVSEEAEPLLRSRLARMILLLLAVVLIAGFCALGTWQVVRLQWKHALIERVEARVHAKPTPPPDPAKWAQVTAAADEYRHVRVQGRFDYRASVLTQATTELGAGFWLLTPLLDDAGNHIFINRGFINAQTAAHLRKTLAAADKEILSEPVTLHGLLRISEPGGGFLRNNDPAANRWHSRDIATIASARGMQRTAPYFVDADADSVTLLDDPLLQGAQAPVGGLTVVSFPNNHLSYALTWYTLALMTLGMTLWLLRDGTGKKKRYDPLVGTNISD